MPILYKRIFLLVFIFFLLSYSAIVIELVTGSYKINENEIYSLGKHKLLGRAFEYKEGKASKASLEFSDLNGYYFSIKSSSFRCMDRHLVDTFSYSNVEFVPYTDKDGWQLFSTGKKHKEIQVYQVLVDGRSYINIPETNKRERWGLIRQCIMLAILFPALLIVLYKRFKNIKQEVS